MKKVFFSLNRECRSTAQTLQLIRVTWPTFIFCQTNPPTEITVQGFDKTANANFRIDNKTLLLSQFWKCFDYDVVIV